MITKHHLDLVEIQEAASEQPYTTGSLSRILRVARFSLLVPCKVYSMIRSLIECVVKDLTELERRIDSVESNLETRIADFNKSWKDQLALADRVATVQRLERLEKQVQKFIGFQRRQNVEFAEFAETISELTARLNHEATKWRDADKADLALAKRLEEVEQNLNTEIATRQNNRNCYLHNESTMMARLNKLEQWKDSRGVLSESEARVQRHVECLDKVVNDLSNRVIKIERRKKK